jgi:hypothetical protein
MPTHLSASKWPTLVNAPADQDTEKDSIAATTGTHKVALQAPIQKKMPHSLELTLKSHGGRRVVPVSSLLASTTKALGCLVFTDNSEVRINART